MEINNLTYIDRYDSLRPIGPQATQTLLDEKKIPALQEHEYAQWADYLFSAQERLLVTVAETVFRHDKQHPHASGLFLACTVPLAKLTARRLVHKMSPPPPDLTEELMYDGAVKHAIRIFQHHYVLDERGSGFPGFLYRALKTGATNAIRRMENTHTKSFGSTDRHPRQTRLEEQLIAKQILDTIANLEHSPETPGRLNTFLRCLIVQLGPDNALTPSTNCRNRLRKRPLMIDFEAVMKELGISRKSAMTYLFEARKMLTQKFNPDGTLFVTRNRPASKRR